MGRVRPNGGQDRHLNLLSLGIIARSLDFARDDPIERSGHFAVRNWTQSTNASRARTSLITTRLSPVVVSF